jgi:hypothetical protein
VSLRMVELLSNEGINWPEDAERRVLLLLNLLWTPKFSMLRRADRRSKYILRLSRLLGY